MKTPVILVNFPHTILTQANHPSCIQMRFKEGETYAGYIDTYDLCDYNKNITTKDIQYMTVQTICDHDQIYQTLSEEILRFDHKPGDLLSEHYLC